MQNIESASDYAKRNNFLFEYLKFHRQLEMNLSENIKIFLSPPKKHPNFVRGGHLLGIHLLEKK
jgi:hypothetical protein